MNHPHCIWVRQCRIEDKFSSNLPEGYEPARIFERPGYPDRLGFQRSVFLHFLKNGYGPGTEERLRSDRPAES